MNFAVQVTGPEYFLVKVKKKNEFYDLARVIYC